MPVAESSNSPARQALLIGLGALGALATIVLLAAQLTGAGGSRVSADPTDTTFDLGDAAELAESIEADGPLLLPDASGGSRDVWLQHLGSEPTQGWTAFAVRDVDAPRDCFADWVEDEQQFVDTCSGSTYPPDGGDLRRYPVTVTADGTIELNLGLG